MAVVAAEGVPVRSDISHGRFWRQDRPAEVFDGYLDISGDWPSVTVFGPVVEMWKAVPTEGAWVSAAEPLDPLEIEAVCVQGDVVGAVFGKISLCDATVVWSTLNGAAVQTFEGGFLVKGQYVDEFTRYDRLEFTTQGLDVWAAGAAFKATRSDTGGALSWTSPAGETASLGAGRSIAVDRRPRVSTARDGGGVEVAIGATFVVDLPDGLTVSDALHDVLTPVLNLQGLCTWSDSRCTSVHMRVLGSGWVTTLVGPMIHAEAVERRPVMLSLADVGLKGLASWLDAHSVLGPLPSMLVRLLTAPGVLQSEVLELATICEGFHRKVYPEEEWFERGHLAEVRQLLERSELDDAVKAAVLNGLGHVNELSMPERMRRLLHTVGPLGRLAVGDKPTRWVSEVVAARNAFAHSPTEHDRSPDKRDLDKLVALHRSLCFFLLDLMLRQASLPPELVFDRVSDNSRWTDFLSTRSHASPRLFGDA